MRPFLVELPNVSFRQEPTFASMLKLNSLTIRPIGPALYAKRRKAENTRAIWRDFDLDNHYLSPISELGENRPVDDLTLIYQQKCFGQDDRYKVVASKWQ